MWEYGPVSIQNIDINTMRIDSTDSIAADGSPDISLYIAFGSPLSVATSGHLATSPTSVRPGIVFNLNMGQLGLAEKILEDVHDLASSPQTATNCMWSHVPDNQAVPFVHDNYDSWSPSLKAFRENEVYVTSTLTNLPGTDDRQKIRFTITNLRPDRRVVGISWTVQSDKGESYSQNTSVGGLNGKGTSESQAYTPFGDFRCITSVAVRAVSCPASDSSARPGTYLPGCPSPQASAENSATAAGNANPWHFEPGRMTEAKWNSLPYNRAWFWDWHNNHGYVFSGMPSEKDAISHAQQQCNHPEQVEALVNNRPKCKPLAVNNKLFVSRTSLGW
jgi:hypothetical protein